MATDSDTQTEPLRSEQRVHDAHHRTEQQPDLSEVRRRSAHHLADGVSRKNWRG